MTLVACHSQFFHQSTADSCIKTLINNAVYHWHECVDKSIDRAYHALMDMPLTAIQNNEWLLIIGHKMRFRIVCIIHLVASQMLHPATVNIHM